MAQLSNMQQHRIIQTRFYNLIITILNLQVMVSYFSILLVIIRRETIAFALMLKRNHEKTRERYFEKRGKTSSRKNIEKTIMVMIDEENNRIEISRRAQKLIIWDKKKDQHIFF